MRGQVAPITRYVLTMVIEADEVLNLRDAVMVAMERLNAPVPSVDSAKRSTYQRALKALQSLHDELAVGADRIKDAGVGDS